MAAAGAVVLLSGGLDSATTLAIARDRGFRCHALSFDYGQRHSAELDAARKLAKSLAASTHEIISVDPTVFRGSALTDATQVITPSDGKGIPATYVPARNTVFLAYALGMAESRSATAIFVGVNAVDYSGYPDCRPEFIAAFQELAKLATRQAVQGDPVTIHAPLIDLGKAEIIRRGHELGVDYSLTVSCYQAAADGRACGDCDSCRFRANGFKQAGLPDPTRYR